MNLSQILKGTSIVYEGVQSIQGLTILPLTCDPQFSFRKYKSPFSHKVSTSNYGTVHLHREGSDPVLVPPHSTYITQKYKAQDHTISKGVILNKRETVLRDSRCVESTQGGYIRREGDNRHLIAPLLLREVAYDNVGSIGHGKLWASIGRFNRDHGAGDNQQIKDYFAKWDKELDQFIAHFERIDNCIGFITLYNDEVVAIDKFPSFEYTTEIWEMLVRDSYASLVIADKVSSTLARTGLKKVSDMKRDRSLKSIYSALVKARKEHYQNLLAEMMEVDFTTKEDRDTIGSKILKSEGYVGQIIEENGVNIMVNVLKRDSFDPTNLRKAREMRSVARSQRLFEL